MLLSRPLQRAAETAVRLAAAAGVHGLYVHNALLRGERRGFVFGLETLEGGLCWFGRRGNLVILGGAEFVDDAAEAVAELVQRSRLPWRIAMGPAPIVDALRSRCTGTPLVHRNQIYYQGDAASAATALVRDDMRAAVAADRDRIVQATLQLNHADLAIDPRRVDRRWLYDTVDERIAEGSTQVIGPVGAIDCKLDFGSVGPGGLVIEGVFTFPSARGCGLAAGLVASCMAAREGAVGLHVGEQNAPARRAYERAGMREVDRCRLLLLG
ncbi:MAG: GNAT family N-acetyltransferase [Planctomycetes bacterium]|nr:GNAT family N-acetyltransferase [Planctomycetota bacterium]